MNDILPLLRNLFSLKKPYSAILKQLIKKLLYLFLFLFSLPVFAQPLNILDQKPTLKFEVLAHGGLAFKDVVINRSLQFKATDSLLNASSYWLRVIISNPKAATKNYYLHTYPNLNTTLYFFNRDVKYWQSHQSGIYSNTRYNRYGVHPYQIRGYIKDTLYVYVDVNTPHTISNKFKAKIEIVPKAQEDELMQNIKTAWLIGIIVLCLFFLNNLYIYFNLRDKSIFFYLVMQLGGMIYLTSYWYFFSFPFIKLFSFYLTDTFKGYDINILLAHVGILVVFYGIVQLTRTYLNTAKNMPLEDKLLKYGFRIYLVLSLIIAAINLSGFFLEYYTVLYDNAYCAILISLVLFTSVKANKKEIPLALPFLMANLMPLTFTLTIPIFHLLVSINSNYDYLLPVLAVISQALCFSIALVTKTKTIQDTLKAKEIEGRELEVSLREAAFMNKLNEMQLTKINGDMRLEKERNELLQERLELNQRELASSTLNMVQKIELLTVLKDQLQKLNWMDRYHTKKNLHDINLLLESNIQLESDWDKFKLHFEQVHPDFFEDLKRKHPSLTAKEVRLYTYFQMNLSHKEIAAILGIDPASVRRAKTRLYKKMAIAIEEE